MKLPNWLTDGLIVILIACCFLMKCGYIPVDGTKPCPTADTVTVTDTLVTLDTIYLPKPVASRPVRYQLPNVGKVISDTVFHNLGKVVTNLDIVADTGCLPSDCDSIRDYVLFSKDSLAKCRLTVHGIILQSIFDNKAVTTTNTITVQDNDRFTVYGHVGASFVSVNVGIMVARKRDMFGVSEQFCNGVATPMLHYGIRLFGK